jgi:menaquinol-cytochrome c reductase iron-sulfur subunit
MVTWNEKTNGFYCPCHAAYFDIEGGRAVGPTEQPCMSPRNLDTLDVEIRDGKDVWVKFEKFQTGTPDKIVKS